MSAVVRKTAGFQLQTMRHAHIPKLLTILGYKDSYADWRCTEYRPRIEGRHRCHSWWDRHEDRLEYLLSDIHQSYRRRAKEVRTDLVENNERAVELNLAWKKVRRLFRNRGICLN